MSNARDKANIPALNFSSTGIDDNATSTAITIDSSQRVGIGGNPSSALDVRNTSPIIQTVDLDNNAVARFDGNAGWIALNADNNNVASGTTITFNIDGTEKMRIKDSGNVGIGTSSPSQKLDINGGIKFLDTMSFSDSGATVSCFFQASTDIFQYGTSTSDPIAIYTNNAERIRIHSDGNISFNTTNTSPGSGNTETGCAINLADVVIGSRAAGASGLFNRNGDGEVIRIQESGNLEGNITVSGSTVSYNGFTGTHWSRFQDNSTPTILKGTVLETLDEMCDWYNLKFDVTTTTQDEDGNDVTNTYKQSVPHILQDGQSVGDIITYNHNGTDVQSTIVKETDIKHVKSKVSDNSDAKNVYGVFIAYDLDGEGYNDFIVASVGSYVVRIKSGETVAKGDLLQSNGDGTAKVQSDDNIKSSSFAKVLSTTIIETYEDGSYLVPCSLMC